MANKRDRIISKYNGICQICGKKTNKKNYKDYPELDHIIPRSLGGSNDESNLCLLCNDCNNKKSNLHGEQLLNSIKSRFFESLTSFDLELIDYELKNGTLKKPDINDLLVELEQEFTILQNALCHRILGDSNGNV